MSEEGGKYWRIDFLPSTKSGQEVSWVFYGTKKELDTYLNEKHSCKCPGCSGKDWWETAQSAEYIVEELTEGGE